MKRSELTISKKKYEYLGGIMHLRGMNHWNVTTPDGKKYHIRGLIEDRGHHGGTHIFQGHYGDGNDGVKQKPITSARNFNDAIRFILTTNSKKEA